VVDVHPTGYSGTGYSGMGYSGIGNFGIGYFWNWLKVCPFIEK
jgi:hypothetical protein